MAQSQRELTSGELVALAAMILNIERDQLKGAIVVGISHERKLRYASNMCCPKHALAQAEMWVQSLREGEVLGKIGEC